MDIEELRKDLEETEEEIAKINIHITAIGKHSSYAKSKEELKSLKNKKEKLIEHLSGLKRQIPHCD